MRGYRAAGSDSRAFGGLEVGTVGLIGRDAGITEIRQPLVQPGFEVAAVRMVQDKLAAIGTWDWVEWSGCSDQFRDALAKAVQLEWRQPVLDYIIDLPVTWELLLAGLKRNIRSSLRHCYNSLRREGLKFELVVTAEREAWMRRYDAFWSCMPSARRPLEWCGTGMPSRANPPDAFFMRCARCWQNRTSCACSS